MCQDSDLPSDAELIRRISQGDQDAEVILWQRYQGRIRFFLVRRLPMEAVSDVMHDVYLALATAVREGRLTEDGNVGGYLYGTCVNLVARWSKTARRHLSMPDMDHLPTGDQDRGEPCAGREVIVKLRRLLSSLGQLDRRLLALRFVHGLSYREISNECGMSEEAARQRVCRALSRLRHALAPPPRGLPGGVTKSGER